MAKKTPMDRIQDIRAKLLASNGAARAPGALVIAQGGLVQSLVSIKESIATLSDGSGMHVTQLRAAPEGAKVGDRIWNGRIL